MIRSASCFRNLVLVNIFTLRERLEVGDAQPDSASKKLTLEGRTRGVHKGVVSFHYALT